MQDKSRGAASDRKAKPDDPRRGRHARPDAEEDGRVRPFAAELQALRSDLDERTRDLQRLTAEYANYRRRVDRDRALVAEQAIGAVLSELLGVLDDVDRARAHGDLVGPFGAVAEQLISVLSKFGLSAFGEPGEEFDPTRHEAVAHSLSSEVAEPTCVEVFRRGYTLGERLLRPALVAVADPAADQAEEPEAPEPAGVKAAAAASGSGSDASEIAESGDVKADADADAEADDADVDAVETDALEAEVVEGEIVDPEAAAVAESESDAAEAEELSDETDQPDEDNGAEDNDAEADEVQDSDAEDGDAEDSDAEDSDAEADEVEDSDAETGHAEVVEDRGEAEAEDRTAEEAGADDGAKGADGEQPDGGQGRK